MNILQLDDYPLMHLNGMVVSRTRGLLFSIGNQSYGDDVVRLLNKEWLDRNLTYGGGGNTCLVYGRG